MYEITGEIEDLQWDELIKNENQAVSNTSKFQSNKDKRKRDKADNNYIYLIKNVEKKLSSRRKWLSGDHNVYDRLYRGLNLNNSTSKRFRDQARTFECLIETLALAYIESGVVVCPSNTKHYKTFPFSKNYVWDVLKALEESGYIFIVKGDAKARIPNKVVPEKSKRDVWKGIYRKVLYESVYVRLKEGDKSLDVNEHIKDIRQEYKQFKSYKDYMLKHDVRDDCDKKVSLYGLHRMLKLIDGSYLYGRIHGARHINMKKNVRGMLTIDGEGTASLDISSAYPQLLYLREGKELEGDAYNIGVPQLKRETLKKVLNKMICSKSERGFIGSLIRGKEFEGINDREKAKEVREKLLLKHEAISHYFFQAQSQQLFRQESDLIMRVMSECVKNDIPVINVHDEVICRFSDKELVNNIMNKHIPLVSLSSMYMN